MNDRNARRVYWSKSTKCAWPRQASDQAALGFRRANFSIARCTSEARTLKWSESFAKRSHVAGPLIELHSSRRLAMSFHIARPISDIRQCNYARELRESCPFTIWRILIVWESFHLNPNLRLSRYQLFLAFSV